MENAKEHGASGEKMQKDVLAEKEYIHRTQIELIEKGQSCEPLFCGVHTSVQLLSTPYSQQQRTIAKDRDMQAYHDGLSLILNDVT